MKNNDIGKITIGINTSYNGLNRKQYIVRYYIAGLLIRLSEKIARTEINVEVVNESNTRVR
jgi:hypothetical protein